MAKGNNGNYLQHAIEVANASFLQQYNKEKSIHISLTHGMAPYEPCDHCADKDLHMRHLLQTAFDSIQTELPKSAHSILHAYKKINANFENYPSTGELLAAIIGRDHLFGTIAEVEEKKCQQLKNIWMNTNVNIFNRDWRGGILVDPRPLCAPEGLNIPWLFSMDPNIFSTAEKIDTKNDKIFSYINESDIGFISKILNSFSNSKQPGIATIFSYGQQNSIEPFRKFATSISKDTNGNIAFYRVTLRGGNRPIGAVIYYNLINNNLPNYPDGIEQI